MNIPLFLVGLTRASLALSLIFAPIVWDIIRELFGAALVVLAIVLLAIAGLVTMAHAKQPNNFGLPPDIAAKVKAECAKVFPFYDTQITCIEDDAKAYHRLQKNDFGLPIAINLMNVAANFLPVSFGQQLASPLTSWPRAHAGCLVACPLGTIRVDGSPVVAPNVRAGTARFRLSGLLRKTCARRELL